MAAAVLAACLPVVVPVAGRCGAGILVLALLAVLAVGLLCCLAVGLASDLGFDTRKDVSVPAGFDLTGTDARVLVCLRVCVCLPPRVRPLAVGIYACGHSWIVVWRVGALCFRCCACCVCALS